MSRNGSVIFTDEDFPPLVRTSALQVSASSKKKKLVAKSSPESSLSSLSTSTSSVPSILVSSPKETTEAVSPQVKLDNKVPELDEHAIKDNYASERLWPGQTDTVRKKRVVTFEEDAVVLPSLRYRRPHSGTVAPFNLVDLELPSFVGLARLFPQDYPGTLIIKRAKVETGGVDIPRSSLSYDYAAVFANPSRTRFWRHAIDTVTMRCAFVMFPPVIDLHEKATLMVPDRSQARNPMPRYLEVAIVRAMTVDEYENHHGLKPDRTSNPSLGTWFYSEQLEDCYAKRSGCL